MQEVFLASETCQGRKNQEKEKGKYAERCKRSSSLPRLARESKIEIK
jgi:hypothetical protein